MLAASNPHPPLLTLYNSPGRVGKTSLVIRYVNNVFSEKQQVCAPVVLMLSYIHITIIHSSISTSSPRNTAASMLQLISYQLLLTFWLWLWLWL